MITQPWGHWLTVDDLGMFVDDQGNAFNTVRECFWLSQLRMADAEGPNMEEQLEFLLSVLVALAPGNRGIAELDLDVFEAGRLFRAWYADWLIVEGLVSHDHQRRYAPHVLTALGVSAMKMLLITRPHAITSMSIGGEAIALLRAMEKVVGPADARMASIEDAASGLDSAFVRDRRRGDFTIVLLRRDPDGELTLTRTIWAVTLPTEEARDRFYWWICQRIDRWGRWTEMAWRQGGQRLSHHLLALLGATLPTTQIVETQADGNDL